MDKIYLLVLKFFYKLNCIDIKVTYLFINVIQYLNTDPMNISLTNQELK